MFSPMNKKLSGWKKGIAFIIMVPFIFTVLSLIVMYLWNAILPDILNAREITFWQASGLLILCRVLAGGFGFRNKGLHHHPSHHHALREKWVGMNDEEKQKFREEWKHRCESKKE